MYYYCPNIFSAETILKLLPSSSRENSDFFPFETFDTKRMQTMPVKTSKHPQLYESIQEILHLTPLSHFTLQENSVHPRKYVQDSYIDWHVDYEHSPDTPHEMWEGVLVLTNTSDSVTEFCNDDGTTFSIRTSPGDLILIKRKGIKHRVTRITNGGERMICKVTCRLE